MKIGIAIAGLIVCIGVVASPPWRIGIKLRAPFSVDSLGACQGVTYVKGKAYLYGDREIGVIREYDVDDDLLLYTRTEIALTIAGKDVINHPTGIAYDGAGPAFIGNTVRLNKEGTAWKALIYAVDWNGLLKDGTLDGNVLNIIEDDACIQGTRPEYVTYKDKRYVATADYGGELNEVRLYDPEALLKSSRTSDEGVLFKKFSCGPWVQNLHWIPRKDILVLIQNQVEGKKWRLTFLDLNKSLDEGRQVILHEENIDLENELEGFAIMGDPGKGLAVSASRSNNARFVELEWK